MKYEEAERKLSKETSAETEEMEKETKMPKKISKRRHVDICSVFGRKMWMTTRLRIVLNIVL